MEQWRTIKDYEKWSVSTHGRIRNDEMGIFLQTWIYRGYEYVRIRGNALRIHRLVAQAFIPNPNNYPMVNHKDENKTNNHVENLEWCTNKYNCNYGTRNKRISEKQKISMIGNNCRSFPVMIDGVKYNSIKDASRKTSVTRHAMYNKKSEYKGHKITYYN